MKSYKANWEIQGLPGMRILAPGSIVKLEDEVAAGLVTCGALAPCAVSAASESAGSPAGDDQPMDLSGMNKAQLVQYAQEKLGLTLDINKKKDDLLAAIADAARK